MSADTNNLTIIGRLTRPAEKKTTASNADLVTFSIVVNKNKKIDGQWVDVASYFDVVYWGKRAIGIHPYLLKGTQVSIEGNIEQHRWTDSNNQNRSKVGIEARNIQLMPKANNINSQPSQAPTQQSAPPAQGNPNFEDDIPF